jgi:predicted ATPase
MANLDDSTFITRVVIENYRSIALCDVRLGPLNFLVGPNGSGKSNFLDALRLIADGLNTTLERALIDRGGFDELLHRLSNGPQHMTLRLDFRLPPQSLSGHFTIRLGAAPESGFAVEDEECVIRSAADSDSPGTFYRIHDATVISTNVRPLPEPSRDRVYLVNASGMRHFRPVYDALSRMQFYNPAPDAILLGRPSSGERPLDRYGVNLASVIRRLSVSNPPIKRRIEDYLATITPTVQGVDVRSLPPFDVLEFRQTASGGGVSKPFSAHAMSDGTLRALAILVALFQDRHESWPDIPLIGIEEPETALHPSAAGVLFDALSDASETVQVIVASHSADLLDRKEVTGDEILAVMLREDGSTHVAALDDVDRSVLRDRLYTAGELLRMNHLHPEMDNGATTTEPLFEHPA